MDLVIKKTPRCLTDCPILDIGYKPGYKLQFLYLYTSWTSNRRDQDAAL